MWVERNGDKWRVRDWRGGRKVTVDGPYRTKTAAKTAMVHLESEALRGQDLVPRGGRTTLAEWVTLWWPDYQTSLKPSAQRSEESRLRIHIVGILGRFELDELDTATVKQWVARLSSGGGVRKGLAPKTVHNCHGLLHTILAAAVDERLIRANPCASGRGAKRYLPRREMREMRFLTDPEIARLLAATPPHWVPLVALLLATGLRWGEAVGLRVGRVDLLATRPKLTVLEHLHELAGTAELVFTDPKSERSRRTVSFTRDVALRLAPLVVGKLAGELLFLTPAGKPVRVRNFRRVWLRVRARAGLADLRVHDLRHTHAAILFAANLSLPAISRRLGHSSIAVTDALYGHIREEVDEGILAAIEKAMPTLSDDLDAELSDEIVLGAG